MEFTSVLVMYAHRVPGWTGCAFPADATIFPGIYLSKMKTYVNPKNSQVCLQLFYGRKLQTGNILGSHQSKWVKKLWFVHTVVLHSVIKKDELPIFTAIWMNLKNILLTEKI